MLQLFTSRDGLRFGPLLLPPGESEWRLDGWPDWSAFEGVDAGRDGCTPRDVFRIGDRLAWIWVDSGNPDVFHVFFLDDRLRVVGKWSCEEERPLEDRLLPPIIGHGVIAVGSTWITPVGFRKVHGRLLTAALSSYGDFHDRSLADSPEPDGSIDSMRIALPDGEIVDVRGEKITEIRKEDLASLLPDVPMKESAFCPLGWSGGHLLALLARKSRTSDRQSDYDVDSVVRLDVGRDGLSIVDVFRVEGGPFLLEWVDLAGDGAWMCLLRSLTGKDHRLLFSPPGNTGRPFLVSIPKRCHGPVALSCAFLENRMVVWLSEGNGDDLQKPDLTWTWHSFSVDLGPDRRGHPRIDFLQPVFQCSVPIWNIGGWEFLLGPSEGCAVLLRKESRVGELILRQGAGERVHAVHPSDFIRRLPGANRIPRPWQHRGKKEIWRFWSSGKVMVAMGKDGEDERRPDVMVTIGFVEDRLHILNSLYLPLTVSGPDLKPVRSGDFLYLVEPDYDDFEWMVVVDPMGNIVPVGVW